MKKFFATIIIAIIFIAITVSTSNAKISAKEYLSPSPFQWKIKSVEEQGAMYYDFNNDGIVNIIDKIYTKQMCLDGTLSVTDLVNITNYLFTGELIKMNFEEIYMDELPISEENDSLFNSIISGRLVDSLMANGVYRVRFLRDCKIIELHSPIYGNEKPYAETPEVSLIKTNYGTKYGFHIKHLQSNVKCKYKITTFGSIREVPHFDDVLTVIETDTGLLIYSYVSDRTLVNEYSLEKTVSDVREIKYLAKTFLCRGKRYSIAVNKDNDYALYTGKLEIIDLTDKNSTNTDIEQLKNQLSGNLFYLSSKGVFLIDGDTLRLIVLFETNQTVSKVLEIGFYPGRVDLILGFSSTGSFVWDDNSPHFMAIE